VMVYVSGMTAPKQSICMHIIFFWEQTIQSSNMIFGI